jgi:hypothetical protein
MSTQAERCLAASRAGDWETAFYYLNSLNMYEMLRCLNSLSDSQLLVLHLQLFRFADRYNAPRIDYAIHVVVNQTLPIPPPGDLHETGQDKTAQEFIDETRVPVPAPAPPYSPPVPPPPSAQEYCKNSGSGFCNDKGKQRCTYTCEDGHSFDIDINCPERGKQVPCPGQAWRR